LKAAIAAGIEFAFTPHCDPSLIQIARDRELPVVAGALTPTEIVAAWQAGATCVKVFPVQSLGGADYIKALQGPLGHIPLIPTGGVTLDSAQSFIAAGAIAVGLSGQLFPQEALHHRNWQEITRLARQLVNSLEDNCLKC
jgi:2-dehydro-3-deoxyphosphogluconate aldolase/(4S)-4-hydroxy-2-oxoglutarate aldolase